MNPWTTPGVFNSIEAASDVVVTPGVDGPVAYTAPTRTGAFMFPDLSMLCRDAIANRAGILELFIKPDADVPNSSAEYSIARRNAADPDERPMLSVVVQP